MISWSSGKSIILLLSDGVELKLLMGDSLSMFCCDVKEERRLSSMLYGFCGVLE